jgi:hypothetical protein
MAQLEVRIDAARCLALLRNGGKRMAFAVVNALNQTAKEIQTGEREHAASAFTLRKRDFVLREAAVIRAAAGGSGFASVGAGRFEARISVGQKPRLLLSGFEEGAERRPFKGKNVAAPVTGGPARPSFSAGVSDAFTFRNLGLRRVKSNGQSKRKRRTTVRIEQSITKQGKVQWKGAHRTFLLTETGRAPQGGVFQRVGPGRDDIRMVYSFRPPFRLDRRLHFLDTGTRIADQRFQRNLLAEVNAALAYNLGFGARR